MNVNEMPSKMKMYLDLELPLASKFGSFVKDSGFNHLTSDHFMDPNTHPTIYFIFNTGSVRNLREYEYSTYLSLPAVAKSDISERPSKRREILFRDSTTFSSASEGHRMTSGFNVEPTRVRAGGWIEPASWKSKHEGEGP